MDRSLRITHVLAPALVGGLETVVRSLTSGQKAMGHNVSVIAMTDGTDHPFARTLESEGLLVQRIGAEGKLHERAELEALFETQRAQIVHTHGYRPDILALPVARRMGLATVSTLHGFTGFGWKIKIYERLQLRSTAKADAVVAVSQGIASRLRSAGAPAVRVHLVRNAYARTPSLDRAEALDRLGLRSHKQNVVWIGRLSREKAPDVMLEAMASLDNEFVHLSFIGEGGDREALIRRTAQLKLTGRVTFHGNVDNAASFLPAFDALVLSSRNEGTPMVLLEAMAAGVPIVATKVGGVPDVLSADDAALVESDNPRALATAIDSTIADRERTLERTRSASARLDREFDRAKWLDRYEEIYRSILA